mmetsp:Transcript_32451/g.87131  ORF Transcript_32451/g.87131 Transcript_32451/m.87131 type:complete len:291 (+) Transcript_32451:960-1832(+)
MYHIHEGLVPVVDVSPVHSRLLCQPHRVAVIIQGHGVHLAVQPLARSSAHEVHDTRFCINGDNAVHLPLTAGDGPHPSWTPKIEVPMARSFTGPQDIARRSNRFQHIVVIHPHIGAFGEECRSVASGRVEAQHRELCLLPIHDLRQNSPTWEPMHSHEITVFAEWPRQIELRGNARPVRVSLHDPQANHRIRFSCERVPVVLLCIRPNRIIALVHDAILWYVRLIHLLVCDPTCVRRHPEARVAIELLLRQKICKTVRHSTLCSCCQLTWLTRAVSRHDVKLVRPHEANF